MTTDGNIRYTTHEETDFDPQDYIDIKFRNFDPNDLSNTQQQMRVFFLKELFLIYNKGEVLGEAHLDVGCRPVCFAPALALPCVNEVVLSDISEPNLDVLRKWKAGENEHQKNIMQFIVETTGLRYTWKQLDRMLSEKVTSIVHGNLRSPIPLAGSEQKDRKFDVVTSMLALSPAAVTETDYVQCVRNIRNHLKMGGYIVVCDALEKSSYKKGNNIYRGVSLSAATFKDIFYDNGFEIKEWIEASFTERSTHFKCFCMLARKK